MRESMRNKVLDHRSNGWPQDPRLARREAESRVCRGRGDDELISASLTELHSAAIFARFKG